MGHNSDLAGARGNPASEDGNSFSSIDLDVNGKTNSIRVFDKLKPGESTPK